MDPRRPADELEQYRNDYLRLRNALHDRATGLPAYPVLFEQLRSWVDDQRCVGVLHVEILNLDLVESLYGWQVFDGILARAADFLREAVGRDVPPETLLAVNGAGGDRFVVFVPVGARGAAFLAEACGRLREGLEETFESDEFAGLGPRLGFRTGHALLTDNPFYRFERRVHAAVEGARTLDARKESRRELAWGADLERVIEEAAISTLLQPVVDLETGDVIGYEALSRGPKDSILEMPTALFALSDQAGVSVDLDRLCRKSALREIAQVPRRGKVFLNVRRDTLMDPEWHKGGMAAQLSAAALEAGDIVLELSERAADTDLDALAACFQSLQAQGFRLALDDVGTGYSTLATLERVRPDYLKVDPTLVRNLHENLIKQDILGSLLQIGQRIGADVVAEGIESEEEARALRAAGTRYGQGYLFARPAPPARAVRRVDFKKEGH